MDLPMYNYQGKKTKNKRKKKGYKYTAILFLSYVAQAIPA